MSIVESNFKIFNEICSVARDIFSKSKELNLNILNIEIVDNEDKTELNINGKLGLDYKIKVDLLNDYIKNLNKDYINFNVQVQDQHFMNVTNLINLTTREKIDYHHTKGEVVLIDFWATWCGPCQKPMSHNQEILEKNALNWNGKVRIIGMSLDDDIESVKDRVEEKKWNRVEHYVVEGGFENEIIKTYEVDGIPQIFLLDKNGDIQFRGHPNLIDLEKSINDLIEDKPVTMKTNVDEEKPRISYDEYMSINNEIDTLREKYKELFDPLRRFNYYKNFQLTITEDILNNKLFNASVYIVAVDENHDKERILKVKSILEELKKTIGTKVELGLSIHYAKSIEIADIGLSCSKCLKDLKVDMPRFACVVCHIEGKENFTCCLECVPEADLEDYINNPIHEHHLYYVPPNSEELLKSAKNIKKSCEKEEPSSDKKVGSLFCDNCGKGVYVCDWSCSVCIKNVVGSYDLCNACFKISQDINHPEYINLKLANGEHDPKTHPMARIPYTVYASSLNTEEI